MTARLLLTTESGIVIAQRTQEDWEQVGHTMAGERVTSSIAREGVALAGTHHGMLRSEDGGNWPRAAVATRRTRRAVPAFPPGP